MSRKKTITEEQKQYILDNMATMSINMMSKISGMTFYRVNLVVETHTIKTIKKPKKKGSGYDKVKKWVSDPWNKNLNLVTMELGL